MEYVSVYMFAPAGAAAVAGAGIGQVLPDDCFLGLALSALGLEAMVDQAGLGDPELLEPWSLQAAIVSLHPSGYLATWSLG